MYATNLKELKENLIRLKKEVEGISGEYLDKVKKGEVDDILLNKMRLKLMEYKGREETLKLVREFIEKLDFEKCGDYDTLKEVIITELSIK